MRAFFNQGVIEGNGAFDFAVFESKYTYREVGLEELLGIVVGRLQKGTDGTRLDASDMKACLTQMKRIMERMLIDTIDNYPMGAHDVAYSLTQYEIDQYLQ